MGRSTIIAILVLTTLIFERDLGARANELLDQRLSTDPDTGIVTIEYGHRNWLGLQFVPITRCTYDPQVIKDVITEREIAADFQKIGGLKIKYNSQGTNPVRVYEIEKDLTQISYVLSKVCIAFGNGYIPLPDFLRYSGELIRIQTSIVMGRDNKNVVVMDSHLRSYRKEGKVIGKTNADDIVEWLPGDVVSYIERTNVLWNRRKFVIDLAPELLIIHFSAFESKDFACNVWAKNASKQKQCNELFFGLIGDILRVGSRVLVYTRTKGICDNPKESGSFTINFVKQLSTDKVSLSQINLFDMSGKYRPIDFYNRDTGMDLRKTVDALLRGEGIPAELTDKGVCQLG